MMVEAGVHRHVLIPPSWEGNCADYSLEAAAKYPAQYAVMGRVPLQKAEDGRRMLETWKQGPVCWACVLAFHHAWDEAWITDGTADWFWPLAERLDGTAGSGKVAARYPRLRVEKWIFAGRSRMDHGARHFRMSALAGGANSGARRLDRNAAVWVWSRAPTCCGRRVARSLPPAQQQLKISPHR
jgi:hypothetical protein